VKTSYFNFYLLLLHFFTRMTQVSTPERVRWLPPNWIRSHWSLHSRLQTEEMASGIESSRTKDWIHECDEGSTPCSAVPRQIREPWEHDALGDERVRITSPWGGGEGGGWPKRPLATLGHTIFYKDQNYERILSRGGVCDWILIFYLTGITTLFFAFSVVLHLMLLLLILPATLSTNHSKHVETSYIVLKLTFSVHNISWHLVLQFVISVANTKCKKQCTPNTPNAVGHCNYTVYTVIHSIWSVWCSMCIYVFNFLVAFVFCILSRRITVYPSND
jgi:hypothetical protein